MTSARHLILQEMSLRPSGEWTPGGGWTVVRIAAGTGYCLHAGSARELNAGDMAIAGAHAAAIFRASQLGVLKLEFFHVLPERLNGLLTVTEWRQLEDASGQMSKSLLCFAASDPAAQKFTRLAAQPRRDGLAARSALLQLWASSVTNLLPAAGVVCETNNLRQRFRSLVGKMSEAELAVRPLTQLAAELHCSERHFSRLFRDEFHVSLRARQTELRLQRAQQLLVESDEKIINVAYESGYRHLGLFNAMFKKRFGVTPSQWRRQHHPPPQKFLKRAAPALALLLLLAQFFFAPGALAQNTNQNSELGSNHVTATNAPIQIRNSEFGIRNSENAPLRTPNSALRTSEGVPHFKVEKYLISGNTVLAPAQINQVLTNHPAAFGTNVSFADIRALMADLRMAYQERGFVTISIGLPQQRLTNAEVKIQVTEGRLTDIRVQDNKFFSTPNVLRALPSLRTNMLLNSHVFQRELDQANASRDRQIYPVIGPGPDPGTTELTLKVKDRLPMHARGEINNATTPGTPDSRVVASAQYDNLWQWEHQVGLTYSFTPVNFHAPGDYYWSPLDLPLIASYSAYYRLPLATTKSVQQQIDDSGGRFGYNENTHQFQMPPPSGRPELTLYASRSVSDTGVQLSDFANVISTPLLSINSFNGGQNVTLNEAIGAKVAWPLPTLGKLATTFSLGADLKHYQQVSYTTNNFSASTYITNSDGSVSNITSKIASAQPVLRTEIYYLPINVGFSGSIPDAWGQTFFNAQANFNMATFAGSAARIQGGTNLTYSSGGLAEVAGATNVHDGYITVQLGADRLQRIYKDWTVKIHADGQWANGRLFSNEQFGMGGLAGVRGYQDGSAYGDAGWRVSIEPQTPLIQFGLVDGDTPLWLRASVFMDYGRVYLLDGGYFAQVAYLNGPPAGRIPGDPTVLEFWGTGFSLTANIGSHLDARFTLAFPLANPGVLKGWSPLDDLRFYFAVGAQF
jgi:hemolysin activation/secretion protein/AraC-like DNA-binding protein